MMEPDQFTVSLYFSFEVDGFDLGYFTRLEGFSLALDHEVRQIASPGDTMHVFPGRVRYTNLKLSRPLTPESSKFLQWMNSYTHFVGRVGVLKALNPNLSEVTSWNLEGVLPISWTGPSYDLLSPDIALETMEFAYRGLLPMGGGGSGKPSLGSLGSAVAGKTLGV